MSNLLWLGKTGEANAWYHISLSASPENVNHLYVVRHAEPVRAIQTENVSFFTLTKGGLMPQKIKLFLKGYNVLKENDIDGIITFNVFPYGVLSWVLAIMFNKKLVLCFIGADFNYYFFKQPFRFLIIRMLKRSSAIICKGDHMTDDLLSAGIDKDKLHYYPHFVSETMFADSVEPGKDFDIITVCELIRRKRVDAILKAVQLQKNDGNELKACIVGTGSELEKLKSLSKELGIEHLVTFTGFQKDVKSYYLRSRIFVQTSAGEGLSLALMESIACGLVPVVSRAGSEEDIIEHGVNGFLTEPDSPEELSAYLSALSEPDIYNGIRKKVLKDREQYRLENAAQTMHTILSNAFKKK